VSQFEIAVLAWSLEEIAMLLDAAFVPGKRGPYMTQSSK
jgi:hypothetical protein